MSKKLAGKKFSGSHTTVIDAAYDLTRYLDNRPEVKKISLGIIRQCNASSSQKNIKIKETTSGLELTIRGNMYVQTIYIYIDDLEKDRKMISEMINKNND